MGNIEEKCGIIQEVEKNPSAPFVIQSTKIKCIQRKLFEQWQNEQNETFLKILKNSEFENVLWIVTIFIEGYTVKKQCIAIQTSISRPTKELYWKFVKLKKD